AAMGGTQPQPTGHNKTAVDVAGMAKEEVAECSCNFSPRSDLVRTAQNLALTISRIEVILDVFFLPTFNVFDFRQVRCKKNGVAAGFSLSLIMMEQYQCRLAQ